MKRVINIMYIIVYFSGAIGIGLLLGFYALPHQITIIHILVFFIGLIFSILLHLLIHESGHLIFGKISGYQLVSFRILSMIWYRTNKKIQYGFQKKIGALGQCLMIPPPYQQGVYPYKLYLMGGVIFNFLFSFIFFILIWLYGNFNYLVNQFIIIGLYMGFINLVPYGINDGMLLKQVWGSKEKERELFLQNYATAATAQGIRYKEFPNHVLSLVRLEDGSEKFNLINYFYALDKMDFKNAMRIIDNLWESNSIRNRAYRIEIIKERMFCMLIQRKDIEEVKNIYKDTFISNDLKTNKMNNKRILGTYELIINKNLDKALEYFYEGLEICSSNINNGHTILETDLLYWLINNIKKYNNA